jgi:hypothetical protein
VKRLDLSIDQQAMPNLREAQQRYAAHFQTLLRKANQLFRQGGEGLEQGLTMFDLEWLNYSGGPSVVKHAEQE